MKWASAPFVGALFRRRLQAGAAAGMASAAATPAPTAAASVRLASRLDKFGSLTVWQEFSPLAAETGAVNLGQGFPNWASPRFVKDAMIRAVNQDENQYCRSAGHTPLVKAVAARYTRELGRPINADTEVTIGVGASECLYALMQSFVNPGDEVILISPAFDIYIAQVQMAGGVPKYVPLRLVADPVHPGQQVWHMDMAELRAAFSSRTAAIVLNTPHNPTGKMFSREELAAIAAILADFPRVLAISDEVYEHIVYDGREHVRLATLPGMYERTLTVSSAGACAVEQWGAGDVCVGLVQRTGVPGAVLAHIDTNPSCARCRLLSVCTSRRRLQ